MCKVYLAYSGTADYTLAAHAEDGPVHLLVAFPELKTFLNKRHRYSIGSWCLDSGAFSVFNSGGHISLNEYIAATRDVDANEIFGLDVIGDGAGTRYNLEQMWAAGIRAIPTYHIGSPEDDLQWCATNADKIAIGGVARLGKRRYGFARQCFARVWPKKIHGFGMASWSAIEAAPFHSVDATSWRLAPSAMGAWAGYTGSQIPLRARGIKDFWLEIKEHQKRQTWAEFRWKKELALLA